MRRVAEVGDLVAHPGGQQELAPVLQFRLQLAANDVENMAPVAPMVGEIAGGIGDLANADIAQDEGTPFGGAGFAGMVRWRDLVPVGDGEGQRR